MMSSAEQKTLPTIASCTEQGGQADDQSLDGHRVAFGLGCGRARETSVERTSLALVNADINIGSIGAMRENIGSVGAMRERNYFQAPQSPFNADAFCRLEPALFHKTRLAQSCR